MIWQLTGKLWPGMRSERRRSSGMCDINEEHDNISLDEVHVCDSDCPLLTEGTCPNAVRVVGSRTKPGGRASLGETRLPPKRVRRQSLSSSWGRENVGMAGAAGGPLTSPQRRLKPLQSLSIDNVTSDYRSQNVPSPGMFSTKSMWSTSDLMLSPGPFQDMETVSK
ncbi:hypothetical protein V1264_000838 [Littorina saxatilis]|uniref:Uncharacterized protein n=1 Tax=Littorina saxatilis TaxID=31220 RepID=A0AAN9BZW5_9CAEN